MLVNFDTLRLTVYFLKLLQEIVRSRDSKILDECDIVVDVGGVYDAEKQRYDHHQRSFQGEFGYGFTTKLSSAGLIYKCVL